MPRKIIIPEDIWEKLNILTTLEHETQIILIYQKNANNHYIVMSYFILGGKESSGAVHRNEEQRKVVFEFLNTNPQYKILEAHTHPEGTVNLGKHWTDHFSDGDLRTFNARRRMNNDYIGISFTPTHVLTWCPNDTVTIEKCRPHPEFVHKMIYKKINEARERLGIKIIKDFPLGLPPKTPTRGRTKTIEIRKRPMIKPR